MGGFTDVYTIYTANWAQCWNPHHPSPWRKRDAPRSALAALEETPPSAAGTYLEVRL